MKINSLSICNLGPYYTKGKEKISFQFDSNIDNNLIIILSKNGGGKTSLLNIIKLSILGEYIRGYATIGKHYYDIVSTLLNTKAKLSNDSKYEIEIEIELTENFNVNKYRINREFLIGTDSKISESTTMYLNDERIQNIAKTQKKIATKYPLEFIELFILDGEQIPSIVTPKSLSNYIKTLYESVSNLKLYTQLNKDLASYNLNNEKNFNDSIEGAKILRTKKTIEKVRMLVEKDEDKLVNVSNKIQELVNKLNILSDNIRNKFTNYDVKSKDIDEGLLRNFIDNINTTKHSSLVEIKSVLSNDIFAYINKEDIMELSKTIPDIKKNYYRDFLYNIMDNVEGSKEAVESILDRICYTKSTLLYSEKLENSINDSLNTINDNKKNIEVLKLIFDKNTLDIQKRINKVDDLELKQLLNKVEFIKSNLEDLYEKETLLNTNILDNKNLLELEITSLKKTSEKVYINDKSQNGYNLSNKLINIVDEFKSLKQGKELVKISNDTIKMFKDLNRKKGFIHTIKISDKDFAVELYDKNNNAVNYDVISSGEKQILLLSIIWSITHNSNYELPFIFDSFLGRMDEEHRETLMNTFIKKCGEQVILLATNEDIRSIDSYKCSKCYSIINNGGNSTLKEGFYGE